MRIHSSWLPCSSQSIASWLITTACFLVPTSAISFQPSPSPNLDLSQLGRVAFAGDFDGVSLYEYLGQSQDANLNGTQSLLAQFPNGAFASVANADAYIQTICPFVSKDGIFHGVVVGGNFTSLGGVEAQGVALFNATSGKVTALPGLSGRVSSVYCDRESSTVYVGGMFTGENSTNAIAWTDEWTNLPFQGFNGPVTAITKAPNGNIVFGGSFTGLGNSSAPKTKDSHSVAITSAEITASRSSGAAGFGDPKNIVCKTGNQDGPGNTWLLPDRSPGFWQAKFGFGFLPTKLRLYNTVQPNRGTKTWRLTAMPINGIMNLTYTDPSGQKKFCDAQCPLPEKNSTFQDFSFVNSVGMDAVRIDISDWYGDGAGLSGIEIFQDDIYSYAINDFNQPTCGGSSTRPEATSTGPWAIAPSGLTNSQYLAANVGGNVDQDALTVEFQPDIQHSGNYSVTVYTPGCLQDSTCATRGRVMISGTVGSDPPISTEIHQTNSFDKYDRVYYGYVDASSSGFRPTVTLRPSPGQKGPLNVVAQRVRFEMVSSGGGLNGIYEYNPSVTTVETDFSRSDINRAGLEMGDRAQVNALAVQGQTTFVAGNFSSQNFSHIFSIGGSDVVSLSGDGLNGAVRTMTQDGSTLYIGGAFNNTRDKSAQGLNNVATYSVPDKRWQPLGAGVNGAVEFLVPFSINVTADTPEPAIAVSGKFTEVLAFGNNSATAVDNMAIWVPSRDNWAVNLDVALPSISGIVTARTDVPGSAPLYAGGVSSQSLGVTGAVGLISGERPSLQKLPFKVQPSTPSSIQKRQDTPSNATGAVTGLMYNENGLNITILGGHFSASGPDPSSPIHNLLFLNGSNDDALSGIPSLSPESTILALATHRTTLFAGGALTAPDPSDPTTPLSALLLYDLLTASLLPTQPPALTGPSPAVHAIAPHPSSADIYIGGAFASAGAFTCPALCIFNADRAQWSSPSNGLAGSVNALLWLSPAKLLVAGDFAVAGVSSSLSLFDADARAFAPFATAPPGPVSALCAATPDGAQLYISGSKSSGTPYLAKFDGAQWTEFGFGAGLGADSEIRSLQVFTTSAKHGDSALVEQNRALLVMGKIEVDGFGSVGAAVFNGTGWVPYLLVGGGDDGGSISAAFVERPGNFFMSSAHHLATGFVVLIALAIALVLLFLLVVAGLLAERYRRHRDGYLPAPTGVDRAHNVARIPPEHLFGSVGVGKGRL
ncbi:cellular morphogenesis protein [Eremomyces bilateralis CBS 781.70]|uniref:Cellular morphogenesis protein n=1 Tax=Eremomyces bilateralis CBS 781.70 TaxID=1392243 RepID=A0A6G1G6U8_9PEZI|nr:cellular morphogenesis protein [Eremomyces bilateralis CBS 781.70]KAF1813656.1 cellular morphogenesis protein [Eremomyces bilateralis CBS 781.70]